MTPITSLSDMGNVRDQVRMNALRSLEFTANTVLALSLEENLCTYSQDIVEDEEDHVIHTKRPRALAVALSVWLTARGVTVLSDVQVPKHEILDWLELQGERENKAATLELFSDGVQLRWL